MNHFALRFSALARRVTIGLLLTLASIPPVLAHAGTVASRVLGQFDLTHGSANTVDAEDFPIGANVGGVAVDTSSIPNHLYIADPSDNRVLGYKSLASLLSGASADLVIGQPDLFSSNPNYNVGKGLNPTSNGALSTPRGVAVDGAGNVYVVDTGNCRVLVFPNPFVIRASTGQNAAFAADIVIGQVGDFTSAMCNGGSSPSADTLNIPYSVTLDAANNLYVADFGNNRVLEFDAPITTATYHANRVFGQLGSFTSRAGNNGGISKDSLNEPSGVAADKSGNLYVADFGNSRILEYDTPLTATTIVGSGDTRADQVWGQGGSFTTGTTNKGGISATSLNFAKGVAVDGSDNIYITDFLNHRALEYDESANPPSNTTANRVFGQANFTSSSPNRGSATPAANTLNDPTAVTVDGGGDLLVVDGGNNRVLKYTTPLTTDTVADIVIGEPDFVHSQNFADAGSLNAQRQIAIDASAGAPYRIFAADTSNNRVLGWRNATGFTSGAPADLVIGQPDFNSNSINGPGGSTSASTLWVPAGVAVDNTGNLYVSDGLNSRVLEFTTPFTACAGVFPCIGGAANKVFGQPDFTSNQCNGVTNTASANTICQPQQVAVDSIGNLYVADYGNNRALEYNTPLKVTAVAGSGDTTADLVIGQGPTGGGIEFTTSDCNHGGSNVNSPIPNSLCQPIGVALDPSNNLHIADSNAFNNRVLEYNEIVNATTAPSNVTPNAVFGQGGSFTKGTCNDINAGTPSADTLCNPTEVAFDSSGNMLVADRGNDRALEYFTPLTTTATAGSGDTTADVVWGQDGNMMTAYCIGVSQPSAATLCGPYGVAIDGAENVYISDSGNNRITAYAPPYPPPGLSRGSSSQGVLKPQSSQTRFATTRVGRQRSRRVTLRNEGPVSVRIFSIDTSGDFTSTNSCPSSLAPGASCRLRVIFAPVTGGNRGGSILINDDAAGSPHTIALSGHGQRRRVR